MKKTKVVKFILFIVIIGVVATFFIKRYLSANTFEYAGTIEATKVDISSQLSSMIKAVNVEAGDKITENQVLINLKCEEVNLTANLADINYKRNLSLLKSGTVSQDTFDQINNAKDMADVHLDWCNIKSPLTGTVLTRHHEPGELALPGTKILTLADIKRVFAFIYVPEPEVAALKLGQKLRAIVYELNNREFIGTIIKINEEAEFTPKNVQTKNERERLIYGVKVSFWGSNEDEILKPGMTIYVPSLKPVNMYEH